MQKTTEITKERIQEIERLTGGKIGTHTFGPDGENVLENCFLSPNGEFIGGFDLAEWYANNDLMVDEEYPHGVAALITKESYGTDSPQIEGMYGYTHRGGQLFRIGDRLFDEEYEAIKEDYSPEEWKEYEEKFSELYSQEDELGKKWMDESGISYVIPFKLRGPKVIETMREAFEAAQNLSKSLS